MTRERRARSPWGPIHLLVPAGRGMALLASALVILSLGCLGCGGSKAGEDAEGARDGNGETLENEVRVSVLLRSLTTAQEQFKQQALVDQDGDGEGEYGWLGEILGTTPLRGHPEKKWDGGLAFLHRHAWETKNGLLTAHGYHFLVYLPTADGRARAETDAQAGQASPAHADHQELGWICYATPEEPKKSGEHTFVTWGGLASPRSGERYIATRTRDAYTTTNGEVYATRGPTKSYSGRDRLPAAEAALYVEGGANPSNLDAPVGLRALGLSASDGNLWAIPPWGVLANWEMRHVECAEPRVRTLPRLVQSADRSSKAQRQVPLLKLADGEHSAETEALGLQHGCGTTHWLEPDQRRSLLEALREQLGFPGELTTKPHSKQLAERTGPGHVDPTKPPPPLLPAPPPEKEPDHVTVDHILIAVKNPKMPGISRSEDEARKIAYDLLVRARKGEEWAALKRAHSDDPPPGGPYSMANHGSRPRAQAPREFARGQMVPAFGNVGFKLTVGAIGMAEYHAQESPFGFHIIQRTE